MKKLSIISFAFIYLVCAIGLYVHAHFCGGELASLSYFAFHDDVSCGCGEESPSDDCCKDVMHFYKVDAHQDANFVKASNNFSVAVSPIISSILLFDTPFFITQVYRRNTHAPPPFLFAKASKLVKNSVFRI